MVLTQKCLKERIHYDPKTGIFTWLPRPVRSRHDRRFNTLFAGKRAGGILRDVGTSYLKIMIDSKTYCAHRLAFLYMTGEFPSGDIDHKDGDGLNNRWTNLRSATRAENCANARISSNNTTGFKGVHYNKRHGLYKATIRACGKTKHLGYFDCPKLAHAAYVVAAEKYFGEFARSK